MKVGFAAMGQPIRSKSTGASEGRWRYASARLSLALRLVRPTQRAQFVWLVTERIAGGGCDLLLAYGLYVLFMLLQTGAVVEHRRWMPASVLSAALMTLGVVAVRLVVEVASNHAMVRYTQDLYAEFLMRLARGYDEMRWSQFVQRNRSELLKLSITTALDAAFAYQLYSEMIASVVVVVVLTIALVWRSVAVAAGLGALVGLLYLLHRYVVRARLRAAATERERSLRLLQVALQESLASAKEVRAYGNQAFFRERLARQAAQLGKSNVRLTVLPHVTRMLAEQGVVATFLGALIVVQLRHLQVHQLLSLLVFYFVLSRRLLPLISQLGLMAGMMEGASENLLVLDRELKDCAAHRSVPVEAVLPGEGYALELEAVSFQFVEETPVLREVSLRMRVGELVILQGVSGGGKSSLLNLIAGVSNADAGTVRVDRGSVAYVPQEIALLDDSVRSNLLFGMTGKSDAELMRALQVARLDGFVESLPEGLETRVGDNGVLFSGGQRQRLGLARAVLREMKLLLLDEATSALDDENEREVLANITAEGGPAILLVTHRAHGHALADYVYRLEGGRLVEVDSVAAEGLALQGEILS